MSSTKRPKNLVVAQSGGPSCVINSTLCGIIQGAKDFENIGKVYGAFHGIEGVLKEELLDLSSQDEKEIDLLRYTPSAGSIGTCRYKLKGHQEEDFERVIEVLRAHDVGYFVYIGGNDSMDTANKIAELAAKRGLDLVAVGGPKTIDNDVGDSEFQLIDHTPGYASCAKYWMHMVQHANEENKGSCPADPVLVMQAMGRKIGFIPAAARMADPNRELPLQIYLAESPCSLVQLYENVNEQLKQAGRCMVVVSEGFDVGGLGEKVADNFGHTQFGSSQTSVAQVIVNYLNQKGLAVKGKARLNVPGTDQRHSIAMASTVDLKEAYEVGRKAAELLAAGVSGKMATILRKSSIGAPIDQYQVAYDAVDLKLVANSERTFPAKWIAESGRDVSDGFLDYLRPLVGSDMVQLPVENGLLRMTRFQATFAQKQLTEYVPQADR